MTAREKFEARIKELGLEKDYAIDGHVGAVLPDGSVVVLVHMDCEKDDPYTELRYPPYEELWKNPRFRQACKEEFYSSCVDNDKFVADLARWLDIHNSGDKCPLLPVDLYWLPGGFETEWFNYKDDSPINLYGREWQGVVGPFLPGEDDWKVGEFAEGTLWMNNVDGNMVLVKPDRNFLICAI